MIEGSMNERRWQELSALVDGELDRARTADVAAWIASDPEAARAFASVAQLTATTASLAGPGSRRSKQRLGSARTAAALAIGITAGAILTYLAIPGGEAPVAQVATLAPQSLGLADEVTIGDIRLPNLQRGGLRLERVGVVQVGGKPQLEAAYVGERGCRVRLVVAAATQYAESVPTIGAPQTTQWKAGAYVYTMSSERMDPQRFVAVAMIAQAETAPGGPTQVAGAANSASRRPCLA